MTEHWAERLRHSQDPEDVWTFRVACYWQGVTEDRAREAARLCLDLPCSVWHAVSVLTGREATCPCCPCRKARGEEPVRI